MWLVRVLRVLGWTVMAGWLVGIGYGVVRGGFGSTSSSVEAVLAFLPSLPYLFVPLALAEILATLRDRVGRPPGGYR